MRLSGRRATFLLSDEGKEFFHRIAGVLRVDPPTMEVEETDDVGIWVQARRETGQHVLLLRWEFILGIELPVDTGKVVGLKG